MVIVNKNENITGFLTINDLDAGEVFRFKDSINVYLMTDDNFVVNVESGGVSDIFGEDLEYRPVERVKCHLFIE